MAALVVAALSARMLAESAAQGGFDVLALDVFGDRDTRGASRAWQPIGDASSGPHIDPERFVIALQGLSRHDGVIGWVAGSGFEAWPDLLERGAQVLPLIGTAPAAVRRVRNPRDFFAFLDAAQIDHPETRFTAPADLTGWLMKQAGGTGGWQVRQAGTAMAHDALAGRQQASHRPIVQPTLQPYFQRRAAGVPMSATFIADGRDACVLGFNHLIVRRFGTRPFVYCGSVGPVPLADAAAHRATDAVRKICAEYALRGLGSLDFLCDGDRILVLEVNPRPSASMASYARAQPHGAIAAHVRACLHGELPSATPPADPARAVIGTETVFPSRPMPLDASAADRLARWAHTHDLPHIGADEVLRFAPGDPVCSVSATAPSAARARTQLAERRDAVLNLLETRA
jgi:predicted ATP-grasp superfamily ATP-dependent carboligase